MIFGGIFSNWILSSPLHPKPVLPYDSTQGLVGIFFVVAGVFMTSPLRSFLKKRLGMNPRMLMLLAIGIWGIVLVAYWSVFVETTFSLLLVLLGFILGGSSLGEWI